MARKYDFGAARSTRQISNDLYRAARWTNNASALLSGDPKRIARRAKNILIGRALARLGIWR